MHTKNYKLCKILIEKGRTDGMADKLDSLLLFERITNEEYEELMSLLNPVKV